MKNYKKIFFVLLIMIAFIMTGCTSKEKEPNSGGTNPNPDSGNNTGSGNNKTEKLEDKISSSGAIAENGHFVVFAKNDNSVPVQMKVEVEFYDENDMILGSDDETFTAVGANSEIAVEMWSTPESFDHYKIYVDVDKTNVTTYFDKIEKIMICTVHLSMI